ncbi:MAG: Crp/Fnr family transcriptional regulator [Sphingomonadales bacterium]|nr:Crp/Fnr family transcriptional regulator [Sphingomonadales bacterium]
MDLANNLITALSQPDRDALTAPGTLSSFASGQVIYEPGDSVDYCYFPLGPAIASFLVVLEDGMAVETTMVGKEGAIGGVVSHGKLPAFCRSIAVHSGQFLRIPVAELEMAKRQSPAVANLFNRYADCLIAQVFQSVACNASHSIEMRAAKWIVAAVERSENTHIAIIQDQFAALLGVGRSYASRVLQRFKAEGLIQVRRGGMDVLDCQRLKHLSCDCNDVVHRHFDRVLRGVYPD